MTAEQSLREGRVEDALSELQQQVRNDPARSDLRVFLFQLLSVMGQWDRALNQLSVAGEMDASTLAMVQTYRSAVQCEPLRQGVFAGKKSPLFFGEPEEWMALLVQAVSLEAVGKHAEAQATRDRAFELAPTTSGTIGGESFSWISDADPRLGPMLEVVLNGKYYWVPFHRIHQIVTEEPVDLRDVVWTPAYFTWSNGGTSVGLIPSRYPGTEQSADGAIRLGRKTDWAEVPGGAYHGIGQRMLATDAGEYPLLELRMITLDTLEVGVELPEAGAESGE
ncbi:MAG: tetratricopeptide repeat protein [Candidatus Eisenbacteria bacterium]|uniref:Tetratricopeptide repeat protein n=1 Tax=Eiseniibacteriota bacterium TaxID=2212470 RepID=A0A956NET5_UNCEI|nr:tetratricopeptide repeat protein [Candidatus Eisenbacteria bacterium]MCB9463357.1 tetratricopeptide repeat protein [Candidatus Eisenbacteria bacterium]